ncbi:MAG: TIGR04149 family rSAM-modified RiPP [Prevotellaceae bacterium]|jgi:natural product precursor|nr:TIGR04149 family rSAM-modified RiPP [Prevotellaceae bacterium]
MKKLNKIKLNNLSQTEIEKRQMNIIRGGNFCSCSCMGPSSTSDNMNANYGGGYSSTGGCNQHVNWDGKYIYCDICNASV